MQRRIPVILVEPDRTAYVASAEDTILSKLAWYHKGNRVSDRLWTEQQWDVAGVLKVQATTLSFAYMRRWAADLHIAGILEQAIGEAGLSEEE